jgi:cellulose synthase/poly-beta-1,6-N-acetylglucosamine synthase-like glycosyltransferase
MKASVIVPTFHEAIGIDGFLRQFEEQTLPRTEFEIIVVDGGSEDGTRELAARRADRVILQTTPGIGGARNDGVAIARSDVIATTDADCRVPPDWIERIVRHFDDPRVVAVCGPDGPLERSLKAHAVFLVVRSLIRLASLFGVYGTGGTNSGFRKDAFLSLGGYRGMPHSDDVDLGFRLRRKGRIVYDPKLFVRLSVRRLERQGYMRTLLQWLRGDLKALAGLPIEPTDYARQKY